MSQGIPLKEPDVVGMLFVKMQLGCQVLITCGLRHGVSVQEVLILCLSVCMELSLQVVLVHM